MLKKNVKLVQFKNMEAPEQDSVLGSHLLRILFVLIFCSGLGELNIQLHHL